MSIAVASGVLAVTTGGTIDTIYSLQGELEVGPPQLADLLADVRSPEVVEIVEACRKDSRDLTDSDRNHLARVIAGRAQRRVLVTHGTDTMVATAKALHATRELGDRTIVLTGAFQPHALRRSDAAFNIGFALGALALLPPGTYIAMHGTVFAADNVRKDYGKGRFEPVQY